MIHTFPTKTVKNVESERPSNYSWIINT